MLSDAYRDGSLCLVLGAGVSSSCGLPGWLDLLNDIFASTGQITKSADSSIGFEDAQKAFGASAALVMGRYLSEALGEDFRHTVHGCLYRGAVEPSPLVRAIRKICKFPREGRGLDSIITFNFDDLIEQSLAEQEVPFTSIYSEEIRPEARSLPIYHVHGFIPQDMSSIGDSALVFSEDAYHDQYGDHYAWSNLIQLQNYRSKTCLFIGLSFSDPNLRRLLHISAARLKGMAQGINPRHFVVLVRHPDPHSGKRIDNLRQLDALKFGLTTIWVERYEDIPAVIEGRI